MGPEIQIKDVERSLLEGTAKSGWYPGIQLQ